MRAKQYLAVKQTDHSYCKPGNTVVEMGDRRTVLLKSNFALSSVSMAYMIFNELILSNLHFVADSMGLT